MSVATHPRVASITDAGSRNSSCSASARSFGRGSDATAEKSGAMRSGGAIASHPATRSTTVASARSAPNDHPASSIGSAASTSASSAAMPATTSSRSPRPSSWAPSLPSTPRKLKRRQVTPAAGSASKSAPITIERMVPPNCGCGWHSTAAARGVPSAIASSASRVSPSSVVQVVASTLAHPPVPDLVEHEREHERLLTPGVVAPRWSVVAGAELGLQQQDVAVGLRGPQLGDPLGGLPVLHAGIVEARR